MKSHPITINIIENELGILFFSQNTAMFSVDSKCKSKLHNRHLKQKEHIEITFLFYYSYHTIWTVLVLWC